MRGRISVYGALLAIGLGLLAAVVAPPAVAAPNAKAERADAVRVDINSASESELTKVPGVGPALAKRIVEFRKQHGPFRRLEDIMKVRGIGEKSFQKMRPHLTVGKKSS